MSKKVAIVIPARYDSTRLPGKPLIKIQNKTIIQWVYEKASRSKLSNEVFVATDDDRIYRTVKEFGGNVKMTAYSHQSGSDRIAEIAEDHPNIDIIVNVQGDEPLITPESIDLAINCLISDKDANISTLIREISNQDEILNPNIVKVIIDNNGKALYFSRAAIPYMRNNNYCHFEQSTEMNKTNMSHQTALPHSDEYPKFYAHIGLYAYRREALLKMTQLPQSGLEKAVLVDYKPIGIDTPQDVEEFKQYLESTLI